MKDMPIDDTNKFFTYDPSLCILCHRCVNTVSYTHLDVYKRQRLVCPTNNNHVLMLKATDEDGNVLPEFEKVLDIDIKRQQRQHLEKHWIRICYL